MCYVNWDVWVSVQNSPEDFPSTAPAWIRLGLATRWRQSGADGVWLGATTERKEAAGLRAPRPRPSSVRCEPSELAQHAFEDDSPFASQRRAVCRPGPCSHDQRLARSRDDRRRAVRL